MRVLPSLKGNPLGASHGTLSTPRYWRIRTRVTRLRGASAFAVAQSASYVRESRSMVWLLAKSFGRVAVTVVVAAALVVSVQGLGTYLKDMTARWTWVSTWLSAVASWLGRPPPPEMNYQAIVTAALAVTGTLAGVYFATVAFVMSTTYKDATSRVRAPGHSIARWSGLCVHLRPGRAFRPHYVDVADDRPRAQPALTMRRDGPGRLRRPVLRPAPDRAVRLARPGRVAAHSAT
jgi:hypothetical protein